VIAAAAGGEVRKYKTRKESTFNHQEAEFTRKQKDDRIQTEQYSGFVRTVAVLYPHRRFISTTCDNNMAFFTQQKKEDSSIRIKVSQVYPSILYSLYVSRSFRFLIV
jgi:hypothetical protein